MKGLRRMVTALTMTLALLPPGLYTEAVAAPPMPYLTAVDYCFEQAAPWQDFAASSDDIRRTFDSDARNGWNTMARMIEEGI